MYLHCMVQDETDSTNHSNCELLPFTRYNVSVTSIPNTNDVKSGLWSDPVYISVFTAAAGTYILFNQLGSRVV